jgi:lipid-binding SYLF domain-containing protein
MKLFVVIGGLCILTANLPAESAQERLGTATKVFNEVMATPDRSIPEDLIEKAECIVIVPGLKKGAFIIGGQYGKGFVNCRKASGRNWGAPAAMRIEGGSFGFQLGGQSTDLVMLIMNSRGMEQLTKSKFTLGGDASVAAGPVGRTTNAATDASMSAEILAWSRNKGLFAGISLSGATLREDEDVNKELYGKKLNTQEIVIAGKVPPPPAGRALIASLDRFSSRKGTASRSK